MNDVERYRLNFQAARSTFAPPSTSGSPVVVGQVVTLDADIHAGDFVLCNPCQVYGPEVEGGAGTVTVDTSTNFAVYPLGPAPVKHGDFLICRFVDFRWVAERMTTSGSGIIYIPTAFCPCPTTPAILTMVSANATCDAGIFQSDTITYGPTPAVFLALVTGATSCFLGDTTFTDATTLDTFRYLLDCAPGVYRITRLFYTSGGAPTPFRDITRYFWPVPWPGNSCPPAFALTVGSAFVGSACQTGLGTLVHVTG